MTGGFLKPDLVGYKDAQLFMKLVALTGSDALKQTKHQEIRYIYINSA